MSDNSKKRVALFLSIFMFFLNVSFPDDSLLESHYNYGAKAFKGGDYEASIWHLNACLEIIPPENIVLKAKILLIISADYMKLGDNNKSELALKLLKKHIDDEELTGIPYIEQIIPATLPGYKDVFKGEKIKVKNLLEVPGKNKKKKKSILPFVLAGVFVAAVIATVLIIVKKKKQKVIDESFRDVEWVIVPAGEFEMGDDKNIGSSDERPVHKVYLDTYNISKYEITFEQFDKFCDDTGRLKPSASISNVYKVPRGKFPVFNISQEDAVAYCKWLSSKLKKYVHLPTEAQWEKAARGTDKRTYPWGNQDPNRSLCNAGAPSNKAVPVVVGSYPSGVSPYGAYDMAGNVAEFCSDWYDPEYYSKSNYINPHGPSSGSSRVRRGGSFLFSDGSVRSSDRGGFQMVKKGASIGFRPVME